MKHFQVASTDCFVSPIGLGTVKFGRNQGVKYPSSFRIPDDREATHLLSVAQSAGINLIDTAPAYGNSEERLGKLLKGQRDRWVICSKTGEDFQDGHSRFDFSPEATRASIQRSLKRLNTDYIDILLVHSDGNDCEIINRYGVLDVLADCKQAGLIRAYGMSTKTVDGGILTLQKSDIAMVTYNLTYQDEAPVIEYAAKHNKSILVKKALASGHLVLNETGQQDPVVASMDFIFSHPGITSTIIGTINPDHLAHNVKAVNDAVDRYRA